MTLDWSRSELLVGVSDPRGAQADVSLIVGDRTLPMAPAVLLDTAAVGGADLPVLDGRARVRVPVDISNGVTGNMRFFGAPAGDFAKVGSPFEAHTTMKYAGAQRLAVAAWGKSTKLDIAGDWPSPSFDGDFLPIAKTGVGEERKAGDAKGFTASWSVPFVARGVPSEGSSAVLDRLGGTTFGVSFVETANPYQSVSRSLKYAPMFIGLIFLAYFMFETTQKTRVHPAQYVLIGLAQLIFYMLLLSIAERIGFDWAFLVAAGATVALISAYAGWIFESRKQGIIALAAFSLLYLLIYVLMRLEDWALLVGAVTSFAAIAAAMYFTRKLNWYGQSNTAPNPATA
jgi:inner membrane protein